MSNWHNTERSRCDRGGKAAEGAVGWSEGLGHLFTWRKKILRSVFFVGVLSYF